MRLGSIGGCEGSMLAIGGDGGVGGGGTSDCDVPSASGSGPAKSPRTLKASESVRWSEPAEPVANVRVYRGIIRVMLVLIEYSIFCWLQILEKG
jgi:hypothetical protein